MTPNQQKTMIVTAAVVALLTIRIVDALGPRFLLEPGWGAFRVAFQTGAAALVFGGLIWLFNNRIWRIPLLFPTIVAAPNVMGPWMGTGEETTHDAAGTAIGPLNADPISITQQFFSIRLDINWAEGGSSTFLNAVPFSVVGNAGKQLVFGATYTYTPPGKAAKPPRDVLVRITAHGVEFNHNRPTNFRLDYASVDGVTHGWMEVTPGAATRKPVGRVLFRRFPFFPKKAKPPKPQPEATV